MTDLEWLEDRLRSIRRVRSNGEDEDEGMLKADVALNGHFRVEIKAWTLKEIVQKGEEYEEKNLGGIVST